MQIPPFGVEQWMNTWENNCALNLAETCVQSLTVGELLEIAGLRGGLEAALADLPLTYGPITGSERLRGLVAGLHAAKRAGNVLVTHGTIGANMLIYQTLVEPGDRVVAITPTYQQHTAIPRSLGAEVADLPLRAEDGYLPDLDRLRALVTPGTRIIALTNPNNPTGSLMPAPMLDAIVEIARAAGAWILSDEVYRGTAPEGLTPAIADLYERGISTGGMSKAFSLAGLRLGWIVGPPELIAAAEVHRDYSTISVGRVDDYLACLALTEASAILGRARRIAGENRAVLADWIAATPGVSWVPPRAGTTALLHYDWAEPSYALAERLIAETGVMFTPGSVMGMEGTLRIGYACAPDVLTAGLARLAPAMAPPASASASAAAART
ncbi:aminotransferase class I/II-fold pyridoxal phosphate-dependent enzyme [Roseisalinus antarcticus]|uniref:Aminotransferase n=1 Tax=Roseisalinus antarcticus TaxID=254357 RepID=A0A1Y5SL05_9RHOB|nr:aminotransferase class I/II-fold pyridoxal phosphate-dependent enzyme [Roseisalinus antarcticus]SLN42854.1 Capreomycidine synthase [Roseisalinus antarcticus]